MVCGRLKCLNVAFIRLKVFSKGMLRQILRLTREEVIGGSRELHKEEFHNLYLSRAVNSTIKQGNEMGGICNIHVDFETFTVNFECLRQRGHYRRTG
jgi:hypothetical protein